MSDSFGPSDFEVHQIREDALRKERDQLRSQLEFTIKALKNIANADYRGNRSPESVSAYNALRELADLSGQRGSNE